MRTKKLSKPKLPKVTTSAKRSMSESRSMSRELPFSGIAPPTKGRRGKRKV